MNTDETTMGKSNGHGARLGGKVKGWPHWTTPEPVLVPIRMVGEIALDPCSNPGSIVCAAQEWVRTGNEAENCGRDGLVSSWNEAAQGGLVYANPDYKKARLFVDKAVIEGEVGTEIIMLVAARTDTRWGHNCFRYADALCFWGPGRIHFGNPPPGSAGNAPSIPSMLVYWGKHRDTFVRSFRPHGQCFDLVASRRGPPTFPVRG